MRKQREENFFAGLTRREFIKCTAISVAGLALGPSLTIRTSEAGEPFTFAYISDAHLLVTDQGKEHRFARSLIKAVKDVNAMAPQPDFVLFGGDLAQLGKPDELALGKEILADLKAPVKMMVGEHDWYLDMGDKWRELFGKPTYSFDHKGVHFVVLNSVIVEDYWTSPKMTPMQRMLAMAQLDNPDGRPFTVGREQREWLAADLSKIDRLTPVVVFSHSPLYKLYKNWNFWTDDAEEVQQILGGHEKVTVIHGHTHQVLTNRVKDISIHGVLSTAWPWPYAPKGTPVYTSKMFRSDPFNNFDGCGWGYVNVLPSGQADKTYMLWDRNPMAVTYNRLKSKEAGMAPPERLSGPHY
ncbi:MAG: metallophosphoesterase [Nitrospirota bacterium]|nr:metallophosphoesterase [Nitrospirota bacterium]